MAEAQKKDDSFDPSIIFTGIGKFIMGIHKVLIRFIDTANGLQFAPFYIAGVFAYFFFAWIPLNAHATAVWFPIFMALIPFVLPALLFVLAYNKYYELMRLRYYYSTDYCVLEIKLPEEITQSPYAMELVLRGIYQTGDVNFAIQEWYGIYKPFFSLEIVSTEGRVRFFMWGQRKYKELMENQIYAHYPTVQVVEVEDYTLQVPYDPAAYAIWGVEQQLQRPDPYPITTYKEIEDYTKPDLKEEFKQDPLGSVIEFMGSLGEGEHLWTQFIIRAHEKDKGVCPWAFEETGQQMDLVKWSEYELKQILKKAQAGDPGKDKINYMSLSEIDKQAIAAMQMKLSKQPFDTGIRSIYIARHDKYRNAPRVGMPSAFRSFEHGSEGRGLNGLRPIFWIGPFNFPWHDFRGIRQLMLRRRYYHAYRMRQFFFPPHRHPWIVLNLEELASLYHFPGRVVATPNLERMPSRRGEAPANLPT